MKKFITWSAVCVIVLLLLVVGTAVVLTRPAVARRILVSRLSAALGTPVRVEKLELAVFSRLELSGVRIGPKSDPLLTCDRLLVRYRLGSFLRGAPHIAELRVENPSLNLTRAADGTWNLPDQGDTADRAKRDKATTDDAGPPALTLTNLAVSGMHVRIRQLAGPGQEPFEFDVVDITVDLPSLSASSESVVTLAARIRRAQIGALNLRQGQAAATLGTRLGREFAPETVHAELLLHQLAGTANALDLAGRRITVVLAARAEHGVWSIEPLRIAEQHGETLEAAVELTGSIRPEPLELDVQISADPITAQALEIVGGILGDYRFGQTSLTYKGQLVGNGSGAATSVGVLTLNRFSLASESLGIPALAPLEVTLNHGVTVDIGQQTARVTTLALRVSSAEREVARIDLSRALDLAWSDAGAPAVGGTATLTVGADRFPLVMLRPFLGDTGVHIQDGELSAALTAQIDDMGKRLALTGALALNGIRAQLEDRQVADVDLRQSLDLRLADFDALTIGNAVTTVSLRKNEALVAKTSGTLALKSLSGAIRAEFTTLNEQALGVLPAELLASLRVERLRATGIVDLRLADGGKTVDATANLSIAEFAARDGRHAALPRVSGHVGVDVGFAPPQLTIRALTVDTTAANAPLLHLAASGTLAWPLASAPGTLRIESNGIDVQTLLTFLPQEVQEVAESAPGAAKPAPEEPGPVDLGGLDLTADLNLRNLRFAEIQATSATGRLTVRDNTLRLKPFEMIVNGAALHAEATVNLGVAGFDYALNSTLTNLPLTPFVQSFKPTFGTMVEGTLESLTLAATGRGITAPNLRRNLSADLDLALGKMVLRNIPELTAQAERYGIAELKELSFTSGKLTTRVRDGKATLNAFTVQGANQALSCAGTVGLDGSLDLLADAGVAGALQTRMNQLQLLRLFGSPRDGYQYLPTPIPIRGTVAGLIIDWRSWQRTVLTQLGFNVTDNLLRLTGEAAGLPLDALGNLLRRDGGADAGDAKPAVRAGDVIQGILGTATGLFSQPAKPDATVPPTPAPAPQPDAATPAAPRTETPAPAPVPVPETRRPSTRDTLRGIGGSILRDVLAPPPQPAPAQPAQPAPEPAKP